MILICRNVVQTLEKKCLDLMRDVFKVQCFQYFLDVTYTSFLQMLCTSNMLSNIVRMFDNSVKNTNGMFL